MRRLAGRAAVLAVLPILIAGLAAGTAAAASGGGQVSNSTCPGIDDPSGITAGPDGEQALWFTNQAGAPGTSGSIGEITTSGTCPNSPYTNTGIDDPTGITAWNGALWFTNFAYGTGTTIGEITTSGQFSFYPGKGIDGPEGITVGPNGNGGTALWFTNAGNSTIGELEMSTTGTVTVNNYSGTGIDDPTSITAGPDPNATGLWFTNNGNNSIGRIFPSSGTVDNYQLASVGAYQIDSPFGITALSGGVLVFTAVGGGEYGTGGIGQMTTSGRLTSFLNNASIVNPTGITAGPNSSVWWTNNGNTTGDSIGQITALGANYSYTGTGIDGPQGITVGPDGALWFTNSSNNSIGRITPPAPQTITFTSTPPASPPLGSTYTVTATATSGQPVTFTSGTSTLCTVSGSTVTFNAAGSCQIDAHAAGDAAYLPAPQAEQTVTVP